MSTGQFSPRVPQAIKTSVRASPAALSRVKLKTEVVSPLSDAASSPFSPSSLSPLSARTSRSSRASAATLVKLLLGTEMGSAVCRWAERAKQRAMSGACVTHHAREHFIARVDRVSVAMQDKWSALRRSVPSEPDGSPRWSVKYREWRWSRSLSRSRPSPRPIEQQPRTKLPLLESPICGQREHCVQAKSCQYGVSGEGTRRCELEVAEDDQTRLPPVIGRAATRALSVKPWTATCADKVEDRPSRSRENVVPLPRLLS